MIRPQFVAIWINFFVPKKAKWCCRGGRGVQRDCLHEQLIVWWGNTGHGHSPVNRGTNYCAGWERKAYIHNLSHLQAHNVRTRVSSGCVFVSADAVDATLLSDLSADLLGLEVESWSLAVSPEFCKQHDRRTVKRQDVIYGGPTLQCYIWALYSVHTVSGIIKHVFLVESILSG